MERRKRPILHALDVAVLDGIEVNVIDVSSKIGIVAASVLPEAALPDAALALARAAGGNALGRVQPA